MQILTTGLELAGFALLVAAAFAVAVPLGLAVAGVSCLAVGFLLGRSS